MKKTPSIMLLIEPSRGYERALLRGIARYSHLHGPWVFIREAPFWEKMPHKTLMAQMKSVDGIIMRECSSMAEILRLKKPVIVSNYATERIKGIPNIVSDHAAIGRMAAEHLLDRGFRNFAFCGYGGLFWSDQRRQGFQERVEEAGYQVQIYGKSRKRKRLPWEKEQRLVVQWLESLPKPVGLLACVDERGQQVADACRSAGITVPEQVAIVGVDDDEMTCTLSIVPLSSVSIMAEAGGYEAARILDGLIKGKSPSEPLIEIKPSHVVARASTDVVAVEDPHVAKAARYIADHCRQVVYVDEVACAAGLSRRVLEKRFRSHLNRSINEHIRHCRVNLLTKLLADTDMSICDIASFMGFPDAAHVARYFRMLTQTSPAEYRRQCRP